MTGKSNHVNKLNRVLIQYFLWISKIAKNSKKPNRVNLNKLQEAKPLIAYFNKSDVTSFPFKIRIPIFFQWFAVSFFEICIQYRRTFQTNVLIYFFHFFNLSHKTTFPTLTKHFNKNQNNNQGANNE